MQAFKVILLVLTTVSSLALADGKVGYIDMQKAFTSTTEGQKIAKDLEAEYTKKKADLDKRQEELKGFDKELEAKKSVLTEEAFAKKRQEFQANVQKFRDEIAQSQLELQKKQDKLSAPVIDKIREIVASIAKEKNFSLVMENGAQLVYVQPEANLTDEVIKLYEKKNKK